MHVAAEDDSSSLLPITELQKSLFTGTREVATATVQVDTLSDRIRDGELQSPALLKIDVQGYELAVLACLRFLVAAIFTCLYRVFVR